MSRRERLGLLIIFALTSLVYLRGLWGKFVWDDRMFFLDNDILVELKPWDLKKIIFEPISFWGDHMPLTDFLFVTEYNLFGLWSPGYHMVSLALYLGCGYAVYLLTRALYGLDKGSADVYGDASWIPPVLVTALWMLHPAHVEVTAYITGQKDLLYGLCSILALYFLVEVSKGKSKYLLPLIVFYLLAFLAKLMAVATAVLIPVLWFLFLRTKQWRRPVLIWSALNVPALIWLYLKLFSTGGLLVLLFAVPDKLIRAVKILGAHTKIALLPWPLNFGYPFDAGNALDLNFYLGAALIAALLWVLVYRRRSVVTLGLLIFVVFLLPISQLVVEISNAMIFDRYLMISLLGFAILVERAAAFLIGARSTLRRPVLGACMALVIVYAVLTFAYVPKFSSDVASLRHAHSTFSGWDRAAFDYVYALIEDGQLEAASELTKREPTFASPVWVRDYFLGWIALERKDYDKALLHLRSASTMTHLGGYYHFADLKLGRLYLERGQYARARAMLADSAQKWQWQPLEAYKAKKLMEIVERQLQSK
jgi:hypothetical protein